MSKKNRSKVKALWKKGSNVWEISQLTGVTESEVYEFVGTL